jgi:uncharacterized protein (TIGR03382 family)
VISHGAPACDGTGYAVRVATYRAWLVERIAALDPASCSLDTRCATDCEAPDPDCAGPGDTTTVCHPSTSGCSTGGSASLIVGLAVLGLLRRRRSQALLVVALAGGCGAELGRPAYRSFCRERPIGDLAAPIHITVLTRDAYGRLAPVTAAGIKMAPLSTGESGVALTVHAQNLDGCEVAAAVRIASPGLPEQRAGMMFELDQNGEIDPENPLHFVELATVADRDHTATIVVEDATGRWAATSALIPRRH